MAMAVAVALEFQLRSRRTCSLAHSRGTGQYSWIWVWARSSYCEWYVSRLREYGTSEDHVTADGRGTPISTRAAITTCASVATRIEVEHVIIGIASRRVAARRARIETRREVMIIQDGRSLVAIMQSCDGLFARAFVSDAVNQRRGRGVWRVRWVRRRFRTRGRRRRRRRRGRCCER